MTNLNHIAESILDSAAKEYRTETLRNAESVSDYAFNALDIVLTDQEADQVLNACMAWVDGTQTGDLNGTDDYYHTVTNTLETA